MEITDDKLKNISYIYIYEQENDKYFVSEEGNIDRIAIDSEWISANRPIINCKTISVKSDFVKYSCLGYTLRMMDLYGYDHVRGGPFIKSEIDNYDVFFNTFLCSSDRCSICHKQRSGKPYKGDDKCEYANCPNKKSIINKMLVDINIGSPNKLKMTENDHKILRLFKYKPYLVNMYKKNEYDFKHAIYKKYNEFIERVRNTIPRIKELIDLHDFQCAEYILCQQDNFMKKYINITVIDDYEKILSSRDPYSVSNIYVIMLNYYDQFYVGKSNDPVRRINEHSLVIRGPEYVEDGRKKLKRLNAAWNCWKLDKEYTYETYMFEKTEVYINELLITIQMMNLFGKHRGRGGPFIRNNESIDSIKFINTMIAYCESKDLEEVQKEQFLNAQEYIIDLYKEKYYDVLSGKNYVSISRKLNEFIEDLEDNSDVITIKDTILEKIAIEEEKGPFFDNNKEFDLRLQEYVKIEDEYEKEQYINLFYTDYIHKLTLIIWNTEGIMCIYKSFLDKYNIYDEFVEKYNIPV